MQHRNRDISQMGDDGGSLLGGLLEFIRMRFLQSDAEKFRQQQAEEDSAYDAYKQYEQKAYEETQQAQEEAYEQTQKAQAEADEARKQYEQQKQKYEQEKQKNQQQSQQEEEFVDSRSNYEVLGVPETASLDEIKKAYRKLRAKLHADKNQNRSPAFIKEAEKELVRVIRAYEALTGKKA